jgi:hypothetical protein
MLSSPEGSFFGACETRGVVFSVAVKEETDMISSVDWWILCINLFLGSILFGWF